MKRAVTTLAAISINLICATFPSSTFTVKRELLYFSIPSVNSDSPPLWLFESVLHFHSLSQLIGHPAHITRERLQTYCTPSDLFYTVMDLFPKYSDLRTLLESMQ